MKRRKWGRIVNIASDTVNLVLPGFTHYVASKAGVIGFTRSLAAFVPTAKSAKFLLGIIVATRHVTQSIDSNAAEHGRARTNLPPTNRSL
jgi:NAD(P)-dependent dehydrogenase (short-subunit alcohol dehydrogenase family)